MVRILVVVTPLTARVAFYALVATLAVAFAGVVSYLLNRLGY